MIIITYPPDFDGELHIQVNDRLGHRKGEVTGYTYSFTHAPSRIHPDTSVAERKWQTLVLAAKAIIAQDERRTLKGDV